MDFVAMDEITRRQRVAEILRRQDELYRNAPSPCYGLLASFEALRMTGESRWEPSIEVELAHGDFTAANEPSLRVVVVHEEHVNVDVALVELLWNELRPSPPTRLDEEELRAWLRPPSEEQRATWQKSTVMIMVEGKPQKFSVLGAGDLQIAGLDRGSHSIIVKARRWPLDGLGLVQITNVEPYVQGWRRFLERKASSS